MLYHIRVKKLDSVKKPKALISLLLKLIGCLSIAVFLVVAGLLIGAYFINNKTDVGADLIIPIVRTLIIVFPIDLVLLFIIFTFASVYHLLSKKNVVVKNVDSLFELSRTTLILFDESEIFRGKHCSVKEVVPLAHQNKNEIIDIVGSIASLVKNSDSIIHAIQRLSFIPVFSDSEVVSEDGYYLATYKEKKYVLGENGSFKYRQEEFVRTKIEPYLVKGYEVLLVGSYEKDIKTGKYADFADVFGVIVIKNEANKDYIDMVKYFQNRDVKVKILSSNNAVMASQQANAIGINNAGKFISLNSLSDIDERLVDEFYVFGGLSKKQKQQIISTLESQGEVVTTFACTEDTHNSNCVISTRDDINADIILSKDASPMSPYRESVSLSNKVYRMLTLLLYKTFFVDLYLVMASILSMTGLAYTYKPIGLGIIFTLMAALSIIFDQERIEPPSINKMWRKVLISLCLSSIVVAVFLSLYALQVHEVLYTGINDINVCLSMCGISLIIGTTISVFNLYLPMNKRRVIILSVVLFVIVGVTGLLWGLSYGLDKELLGLCFNKFNGQNIVSLAIALFIYISIYFTINYLIDNYNERGEE